MENKPCRAFRRAGLRLLEHYLRASIPDRGCRFQTGRAGLVLVCRAYWLLRVHGARRFPERRQNSIHTSNRGSSGVVRAGLDNRCGEWLALRRSHCPLK